MWLSNVINKIKELFNETGNSIEEDPKYRDFVDNVIPSLKFGDIIYGERFNNGVEKENMGSGHTTGPFVVVSFDNDKVVGIYCTSNPDVRNGLQIGEHYHLFNRDKDSFVSLSHMKTIDAEAYINTYPRSLSFFDIDRLKKKICLTSKNYKYDDFYLQKDLNVDFHVDYEVGDVVNFDNNSYVIVEKKDNNHVVIVPIINYNYRSVYVNFAQEKIDYCIIKEVEKKDITYINSIIGVQMKIILNKYIEYKNKKDAIMSSNTKKLERGCLINIASELYYVFGIEGSMANSFLVQETGLIDKTIMIMGKRYTPSYEITKQIDFKDDSYQILGLASEKEMDTIKEAKKSYKKTKEQINSRKKTSNNVTQNVDYQKSCELLVCLKDNITSRYLIYRENASQYCLISLSSLMFDKQLVATTVPKTAVMKTTDITLGELGRIKRNLLELENSNTAKQLLKTIFVTDSYGK